MTCKRCKGWKVVRGAGSRKGLPYTTKRGAETACAPAPCPECVAFVPHEWEREADRVTCLLCGLVVRTVQAMENVQSCPGAAPARITALRDEKLRANGVLIEGAEWGRGAAQA